MADTDGAESDQDLEAPEEELDNEALLYFSKYIEARQLVPWQQWTFRERANYYIDRVFLGLLVIFFIMILGEVSYKIWYVTNVKMIAQFVSDSVIYVFNWLFTQERQEQLAEL